MAEINDQSLSTFLDGIDDTLGLSSDISLPINLTDITNTNCSDLDNEFLGKILNRSRENFMNNLLFLS